MALHKADSGCRPEAQYTYYEGCLLASRAPMPPEPPRPETPQKASCRPMSGGGGTPGTPRTPAQDHVPTLSGDAHAHLRGKGGEGRAPDSISLTPTPPGAPWPLAGRLYQSPR